MNQKYVKIVVYVVILTMVVTSFSFAALLPAVTGSASFSAYGAETGKEDGHGDDVDWQKELVQLPEYIKFIHEQYKDDVDYETLLNGAYNGVVDALDDPYSVYFSSSEETEEFTQQVDGSFEGIGVNLQMIDGKCTVVSPIGGSPAAKAGIKSDDVITAVDGKSTAEMALAEISGMLRGEKGSEVKVTVERDGKSLNFTIKRDAVSTECVSYKMLTDQVGYIAMTGFDSDADLEFKKARIALTNRGAEKLILDLRNNPGGYINMALSIADQILDKGYISHFESRGKLLDSYEATNRESVTQPIVLLLNGGTASASKILAAALLDNGAATAVGTTTYGKGVAQTISEVADGKSLKLSIYYFLRPNKERIQGIGITPTYVVTNRTTEDTEALEATYAGFAPMAEKVKPQAGDTGLNVYGAQQRLAFLGFSVEASGTMDAATVDAVKQFQKQNALYAYGALDYTTMNKLEEAAYKQAHGVSGDDLQLAKALALLQ